MKRWTNWACNQVARPQVWETPKCVDDRHQGRVVVPQPGAFGVTIAVSLQTVERFSLEAVEAPMRLRGIKNHFSRTPRLVLSVLWVGYVLR